MSIHELSTMWHVETPLGHGRAIFVESEADDTYWTVVLADSLALVTFTQDQIRMCRNYTMKWKFSDDELADMIKI